MQADERPLRPLDLQGTLGGEGFGDIRDFKFFPFAAAAIHEVNEAGLLTVVVINQTRISQGEFTEEFFNRRMRELQEELARAGVRIDDGCRCHKPRAGMIEDAATHLGIDLSRSWVVDDGEAWDAVRFQNPLDYPMTTGPAMIVAKGRFNGQRTSHWVNPGERTTLRITKALSIRTRSTEHEVPGEREYVDVGGRRFRKTEVTGELLVCNHRKESVQAVIRREFSGELLEADESPENKLREEGVYSVNPRHQLQWSLNLEPGQEKTLRYRYSVLVLH